MIGYIVDFYIDKVIQIKVFKLWEVGFWDVISNDKICIIKKLG